jgi:GNAT superfamily N-acetyltransferase
LSIARATDEVVPAITALANTVAPPNLSEEERQNGFLLPYTADQYRDFTQRAEHFYVAHLDKQVIGFVLAHSSEKIDLFEGEVYLHMKTLESRPFMVVRQICIAPEFSHKGYGRKLYDFLFARVHEDSTRYPKALTFIWKSCPGLGLPNPASERFHRAVGWKELEIYARTNGDGVAGIWARTI